MKVQTRLVLSALTSLAVSAVVLLFVFAILRDIKEEFTRAEVYNEIENETAALNLFITGMPSHPSATRLRQIKETWAYVETLLGKLNPVGIREESLVQHIRINAHELGFSLNKLIAIFGPQPVAMSDEQRKVLLSELWMKIQFISDDTRKLMEISQAEIHAAQQRTAILISGLILGLILINAGISYFSGRTIIRSQDKLRRALGEAEEGRRVFDSMMENIPIGITIADAPDVKIRAVSRYGRKLTARPLQASEPIPGQSERFQVFCADGVTPAGKEVLPLTRAIQQGELIEQEEWLIGWPDGSRIPVLCTAAPIRDVNGNITGGVIGWQDITERKRYEEALRKGKERLELLATVAERLLKAEDPQVVVEELCRLVMDHLDCQFFFNYLADDAGLGLHLNACAGVPPEDAQAIRHLAFGEAVCGCVARDGERIVAQNIQHGDDPRTRLVRSYGVHAYCCHPLMAKGRLIGTLSFGTRTRQSFAADEVALMKSVSGQVSVAMERLRADTSLRELNISLEQRVAERTRLAETRAKQLQALAVELIEAEEQERRRIAEFLHEDLQQILAAARMQLQAPSHSLPSEIAVVQNLLADSIEKSRHLSRELSPPVLHHSGLQTALQWLARQMQEQFGLKVDLVFKAGKQCESWPLKVFLFRAVQELLFNSVKHAGVTSAGVEVAEKAPYFVVTVSDQGKGFDPDILMTPVARSGLGLLSLRERAQYIGGSFVIDSAPGKGSRFTLKVPFSLSAERPKEQGGPVPPILSAAEESPIKKGIRVLFADDHKVMRQGLVRIVEGKPDILVVGEANNGMEAVSMTRKLMPDLVVMDVSMPEMDGVEATRRIKSEMPGVRVIGLSMYEDDDISRSMQAAGADAFLIKTASSAELLRAIYGVGVRSGSRPSAQKDLTSRTADHSPVKWGVAS